VEETVDLRTQFGREREVRVEPLRWVCEPVYKARRREELPPAPPPVLPLACYPIERRPVDRRVRLTDRNGFFSDRATVDRSLLLCNPGLKAEGLAGAGGEARPYPAHLVGFALQAPSIQPTTVFTRDRHGVQEVRFQRSAALLEPATKNRPEDPLPPGLPQHCYRVEKPRPADVPPFLLVDQFGETRVRLRAPELFCDPAEKTLE
jgi:hypothetical protein